jgi:hypothetical protein
MSEVTEQQLEDMEALFVQTAASMTSDRGTIRIRPAGDRRWHKDNISPGGGAGDAHCVGASRPVADAVIMLAPPGWSSGPR